MFLIPVLKLSLPPLTDKLEVCEKQCHLLDMLLVCSQDLQKALRSISYIDFSVCHKNRSSLLPVSHPSCLPTPVLPDSKGTLNEGKGEGRGERGKGRRYAYYFNYKPSRIYVADFHINYPNQTVGITWSRFVQSVSVCEVDTDLTGPG